MRVLSKVSSVASKASAIASWATTAIAKGGVLALGEASRAASDASARRMGCHRH